MNGLLEDLSASPGALPELARLAHGLEWLSAGIDLASIAIMLVGWFRFIVGFAGAEFNREGLKRIEGITGIGWSSAATSSRPSSC